MMIAACIQMASGPNVNANLLEAERLISEAVERDAKLVVLPENFAIMGMHEEDKVAEREADGSGPIQDFLADQAAKRGIWLVGGTVPLVASDDDKVRAACLMYDAQGRRVARYDKVHLFDVQLLDSGERYIESETIEAGTGTVVAETPFGRVGFSVCYDLRFPELYRHMLDSGVDIIVAPSAFTEITGRAHWETLVRARAIENLSYVLAAAQGGYHVNGRETHGNSMIVDPWGTVLDRLPNGSGIVTAALDLGMQETTRKNFPSIDHRKIHCGSSDS